MRPAAAHTNLALQDCSRPFAEEVWVWVCVVCLQAGAVVQQSLSQIRTVAAYNGEEAAAKEYDSKLDVPQKVRRLGMSCPACVHWGFDCRTQPRRTVRAGRRVAAAWPNQASHMCDA